MTNDIYEFFINNDIKRLDFKAEDAQYVVEKLTEVYNLSDRTMELYINLTKSSKIFTLMRSENRISKNSISEIIDFLSSDLKDLNNYFNFFSKDVNDNVFYDLIVNTKTMKIFKDSIGIFSALGLKDDENSDFVKINNITKRIIELGYDVQFKGQNVYYKGVLLNHTPSHLNFSVSILPLKEENRGIFPKDLKIFSYNSLHDGAELCETNNGKDYDSVLNERSKIDKYFILASKLNITAYQEEKVIELKNIDFNKNLTLYRAFRCGHDIKNPDESNEIWAKISIEVLGKDQFDNAIDFYKNISDKGEYILIELGQGEKELRKIAQNIKDEIPYKNKVYLESIWHSSSEPAYSVTI